MNVWKAAVKNYSYVFSSFHSELLSCLNGEINWISVVKAAKAQNESNFLCFKGLPVVEMVIGTSLLG